MTPSTPRSLRVRVWLFTSYPILVAFAATLGVRLIFVALLPYDSGDWVLYRNVAENIYRGCGVAVTIPGVGTCLPHFGGNQLPLYPAFAAAVWVLFGHSNTAILIIQSIFAAIAVAYCTQVVCRFAASRLAGLIAGLLLAVSPVTAVYAGSLLTETLAVAATVWVVAELLRSITERRLRTLPLAVATGVAVWVRMDSVLLLAPIALVAFQTAERPRRLASAAITWGSVTALVALSCLSWSVRNVAVGLPPLPRPWVMTDGTYWSPGYTHWVTTWVIGQQERGDALYYDLRDKKHFRLSPRAFASDAERRQVLHLIALTRAAPGTGLPPEVDAGFSRLAAAREGRLNTLAKVGRLAARARALAARWFFPWVSDVGDGRERTTFTDFYRFSLVLACIMALGSRNHRFRVLAFLSATYAGVRVIFFAAGANTELRYLVELAPFAKITAGVLAAAAIRKASFRA